MKLFRWLRSRPLARVRRNLATEKRIRAGLATDPNLSAEMKAFYRRELLTQNSEARVLKFARDMHRLEGEEYQRTLEWRRRVRE